MTLSVDDLASSILTALGSPVDKDGNPVSVTDQMRSYARAVIDTLMAGTFANAPGTINGSAAPGGPLMGGTGVGGVVSGLSPSVWGSDLASAFPAAPKTADEARDSTTYLMASALVGFASGDITGTCTATPSSAGILANGAGTDGTISGLDGSAWATAAEAPGPLGVPFYSAVAAYLMKNASCSYASGAVTGTFAANGGPLVAGTGIGGMIA